MLIFIEYFKLLGICQSRVILWIFKAILNSKLPEFKLGFGTHRYLLNILYYWVFFLSFRLVIYLDITSYIFKCGMIFTF